MGGNLGGEGNKSKTEIQSKSASKRITIRFLYSFGLIFLLNLRWQGFTFQTIDLPMETGEDVRLFWYRVHVRNKTNFYDIRTKRARPLLSWRTEPVSTENPLAHRTQRLCTDHLPAPRKRVVYMPRTKIPLSFRLKAERGTATITHCRPHDIRVSLPISSTTG